MVSCHDPAYAPRGSHAERVFTFLAAIDQQNPRWTVEQVQLNLVSSLVAQDMNSLLMRARLLEPIEDQLILALNRGLTHPTPVFVVTREPKFIRSGKCW